MKKCTHENTHVKDSRPAIVEGQLTVRRRRKCIKCNERITTYELTAEQLAWMQMGFFNRDFSDILISRIRESLDNIDFSDLSNKILDKKPLKRSKITLPKKLDFSDNI